MPQDMPSQNITVKQALDILTEAVERACRVIDAVDKSDLTTLLKYYKQIHELKEIFDVQQEIIVHIHDQLSYDALPNLMEDMQIDSVKAHGRNFVLSTRVNASISNDNRDAGISWVRDIAKVPELIVPHVNPKSLTSLVKGYFENNGEWPPEDAIKVHQKRYIAVRKK